MSQARSNKSTGPAFFPRRCFTVARAASGAGSRPELEPTGPVWDMSAHAGFTDHASSGHGPAGAAAQAKAGAGTRRRRLAPAVALYPVALAHRRAAGAWADRDGRVGPDPGVHPRAHLVH